jgi:2-methylfumaryl-CoA isomerase
MAIASMGHLGMLAEAQLVGPRPRVGNTLFGAFGRDFVTADGRRLMVVAITPRQWEGLIAILGIGPAIGALEAELGVSFARDEGLRFEHRDRLYPLFEAAFSRQHFAPLTQAFEQRGVCWGPYQTLADATLHDPALSAANPLLTEMQHPGGRYLTPGAAATMPGQTRATPGPAPRLGQDTEEVLASVLSLPASEIGRLRDAGIAG